MENNIEVELRGPLDENSYKVLLNHLEKNGKLLVKQNRFFIDYSTFLEGISKRKSDIRFRITNGKVELIVKKGEFGGYSREEVSVFIEKDDIKNALMFMSLLGYKKGIAGNRGIVRYMIDGIEIAIQDVRKCKDPKEIYSRFFEAEIMANAESGQEAKNKILKFIEDLSLNIFKKEEWYEYCRNLNIKANGVFDYEKDDINDIIN
ncbi:MAG: hypothetical protein KAI71_02240 [Candidatus Pacebacteria bacterium]|nr:hypothetical protein [Candidatus Paceibacterota bacterium]